MALSSGFFFRLAIFLKLCIQLAGQPQVEHPEVRAQAPQRVLEGGWLVLFHEEVPHPGWSVSCRYQTLAIYTITMALQAMTCG